MLTLQRKGQYITSEPEYGNIIPTLKGRSIHYFSRFANIEDFYIDEDDLSAPLDTEELEAVAESRAQDARGESRPIGELLSLLESI